MRFFYLLTTLFLVISIPSFSMDINSPIIQPTHVACLGKTTYAIAGLNGFAMVNTKTSDYRHLQEDKTIDDLAVNNNRTKIGTSSNGVITVYDVVTGNKEWDYDTQTHLFTPITFNSQKNNVLIAHVKPNRLCFFTDKQTFSIHQTFDINKKTRTPISCHPYKENIAYISKDCWTYSGCSFVCLYHSTSELTAECTRRHSGFINSNCTLSSDFDNILQYECSPDGNCNVIIIPNDCCYVWDYFCSPYRRTWRTSDSYIVPLLQPIAVAFHPTKPILAVLIDKYILEFYKLTGSDPYSTRVALTLDEYDVPLDPIDAENHTNLHLIGKRIAFSQNGKHILVALANQCFLFPVPLEVLYTKEIKKSLKVLQ